MGRTEGVLLSSRCSLADGILQEVGTREWSRWNPIQDPSWMPVIMYLTALSRWT